jgi:hypothetical protein
MTRRGQDKVQKIDSNSRCLSLTLMHFQSKAKKIEALVN